MLDSIDELAKADPIDAIGPFETYTRVLQLEKECKKINEAVANVINDDRHIIDNARKNNLPIPIEGHAYKYQALHTLIFYKKIYVALLCLRYKTIKLLDQDVANLELIDVLRRYESTLEHFKRQLLQYLTDDAQYIIDRDFKNDDGDGGNTSNISLSPNTPSSPNSPVLVF